MLAPAQIVSFGVKAGVPLNSALPNFDFGSSMVDTGRWTLGPTVELRLVHGFSLEVDALYRGYRLVFNSVDSPFAVGGVNFPSRLISDRQDTKIWDFPLLLKYRFTAGLVHPFLVAGYTWSHESSDEVAFSNCLGTSDVCNASNQNASLNAPANSTQSRNRGGPTAGIGVELKYGKVKIAPEMRYTRFGNPNGNNATLMVGFTF